MVRQVVDEDGHRIAVFGDEPRDLLEREREAEQERKRQAREAAAAERQRQKTIETGVRTAGRVITSRAGQSFLRGVFDTIFGGGRKR